jgi:hypothetical protein
MVQLSPLPVHKELIHIVTFLPFPCLISFYLLFFIYVDEQMIIKEKMMMLGFSFYPLTPSPSCLIYFFPIFHFLSF